MDQREYYRESIELQRRQTRAMESQENWLQTLMGWVVIAAVAVIYVGICIVGLIIQYWYISIPVAIMLITAGRARRARIQEQQRARMYKFRPLMHPEYLKKECPDLYVELKGRGCKEPR